MNSLASIITGALQVGVAAVGSVEITAWPPRSTATHSLVVGHDTLTSPALWLSISVGALQVGVAAVGSVEITAWPLRSTATQSSVEAHDTLSSDPKSPTGGFVSIGVGGENCKGSDPSADPGAPSAMRSAAMATHRPMATRCPRNASPVVPKRT
jgi:hypothetical protein